MVLSLSISPAAEATLKVKAAAAGVDVETYAARHLELMASPLKLLRDISGPIAEEFARSGMSEDELSHFLEAEKHAMRAERHGRPSLSEIRPVSVGTILRLLSPDEDRLEEMIDR